MAAGNRHLGYKEVLNLLEEKSPGSKAAFATGFFERAHDRFVDSAHAARETLSACDRCGAPTTSDVCAFCRLRERAAAEGSVAGSQARSGQRKAP